MAKKKVVVRETVSEYLARGGEINRVQAQESLDEPSVMKHKPLFTVDSISLGDGAFYFAEKVKRNRNIKGLTKFKKKLDDSDIPANLKEIILPALADIPEPGIIRVEEPIKPITANIFKFDKKEIKFNRDKLKKNKRLLEKKKRK